MTVEDAIETLANLVNYGLYVIHRKDDWASKFVRNVAEYTARKKPLSTEQSRIILKLIAREKDYLVENGVSGIEIELLLRNPTYRQTPYPSANIPREVRYLGDNLLGFRFKRNDEIVDALRNSLPSADHRLTDLWFHREHRIWVVPVTRHSLDGVMRVIREHRFDFDDAVAEYLTDCENGRGKPSAFIADRDLGLIAGQVYDCDFTAWWVRNVIGGERA